MSKATTEKVGQRLKRLRTAAGYSQRELSEPGVSYAYISRIEAGTREPSVKALRKLARKLGVTAAYLERGEQRTETDDMLREARALCEQIEITFEEPRVVLTWHRTWNCTEEEIAAGLEEVGGRRVVSGETLTDALVELLTYEARMDALDAEVLRVYRERQKMRTRQGL